MDLEQKISKKIFWETLSVKPNLHVRARYAIMRCRDGARHKTIADELQIHLRTVNSSIVRIVQQLGAISTCHAVAKAIGYGLISGFDTNGNLVDPTLDPSLEEALSTAVRCGIPARRVVASHKDTPSICNGHRTYNEDVL